MGESQHELNHSGSDDINTLNDAEATLEGELAWLKRWLRRSKRDEQSEIKSEIDHEQRSPAGGFRLSKLRPSLHKFLSDDLGVIGGAVGIVNRSSAALFLLDSLPLETGAITDAEALYRSKVAGFFPELKYQIRSKDGEAVNRVLLELIEPLFRGRRTIQRFVEPEVDLLLFGKPITAAGPEFYNSLMSEDDLDQPNGVADFYRSSPFVSSEEKYSVERLRSAQVICAPGEILFFLYGWRIILRALQVQAVARKSGGEVSPFLDPPGDKFTIPAEHGLSFNIFDDLDFEEFATDLASQANAETTLNEDDRMTIYPEIMLKSRVHSFNISELMTTESALGAEYLERHRKPEKLNLWPEWKALGFVYRRDGSWWLSERFCYFLRYFLDLFGTGQTMESNFADAVSTTRERFDNNALDNLRRLRAQLEAAKATEWPLPVAEWPDYDFDLQEVFRAFFHSLVGQRFRNAENPDPRPLEIYQALYLTHKYARFPILPYFVVYSATSQLARSCFGHVILPLHRSRSFSYNVPGIGRRSEILFGLLTIDFRAPCWAKKLGDDSREVTQPDNQFVDLAVGIVCLRHILHEVCAPLIERGFYDQEFAAEKRLQGKASEAAAVHKAISHEFKKIVPNIETAPRWIRKRIVQWLLGYTITGFSTFTFGNDGDKIPTELIGTHDDSYHRWFRRLFRLAAQIEAISEPAKSLHLPPTQAAWRTNYKNIEALLDVSENLRYFRPPKEIEVRCILGVTLLAALRNTIQHSTEWRRGIQTDTDGRQRSCYGTVLPAIADLRVSCEIDSIDKAREQWGPDLILSNPTTGRKMEGTGGSAGAIQYYLDRLAKQAGISTSYSYFHPYEPVAGLHVCRLPSLAEQKAGN